ncbi:group 10 secretory phospholipase A2 [Bufo gargarizans]|uniref:group 10 secretory phospholipase A2 n=1 Tax=Bufo gargarizans TaxID=30331 RepID=UPI001CF2A3C6|nr:group 10 secretory phospholipase A2 [Bufo gargarizans]
MEFEVFLVFFLCSCSNGDQGGSRIRQKRGIIELAGAIKCGTGRSSLLYLGYGCYCGIGGQGTPKDKTDWCCYKHDCCYGNAEHFGCYPKSHTYNWQCISHYIKCDYTRDFCQKMLCKCDKELSKCLRKAPYNARYAMYPNFLCGREDPKCTYYKE